ncbi:MAG TPA: iron-containing redox enzyme family protein [Kofleriaceae bacterium]|nr:iron-containing redox enzyme family protein [Kofleriaceae bacterium]
MTSTAPAGEIEAMLTATSPQALRPELVDAYRVAMTRVSADDWNALRRRADAACDLARRAFVDDDRAAWEVVQVAEWRLQRAGHLRPTDPGDVLVLDAFYRIEESTLPDFDLPAGLTPAEFCRKLTDDIAPYSALESPTIKIMQSGTLGRADWEYFGYQWLAPSGDFTRMIALASLPLPHRFSRFMYHNLFDEAGRGTWERAHQYLLEQFLAELGVDVGDEEKLLYWSAPEHVALVNGQNRLLWHREAAWSLGSMYLYEKLLPFELASIRDGLLRLGVPRDKLAWFDEHIVVDVSHAEDWLGVVESFLLTHEEQRLAYRAAMERGRLGRVSWDCMYPGWERWKETGTPPHLPARELREATGL